jgi:hypothetical protein
MTTSEAGSTPVRHVELDLYLDGGGVTGWLNCPDQPRARFSGWMGLLSALMSLECQPAGSSAAEG